MKVKDTLENYMFILPAVTIFALFYIIPFIWVFQLGLYEWDGILPTKTFVGLGNFREILLDKIWWGAMFNAGYITLIALTFQNALAFLLAWACDREIRMKNFYRLVFFLPPVLSEVVVGLAWQWILDGNYGLLNHWLTNLGLASLARNWLSDPATALNTVAIVHSWKGFGWGFLIFLAGLQTIPRTLRSRTRRRSRCLGFFPQDHYPADGARGGISGYTHCPGDDAGICFNYRYDQRRAGVSYAGAGVKDFGFYAWFIAFRLCLCARDYLWFNVGGDIFYSIPLLQQGAEHLKKR